MIDLRNIEETQLYKDALEEFKKASTQEWTVFKTAFMEKLQYKCPMCEQQISIHDDIDHFRPKAKHMYPFLEYIDTNYIMICKNCNISAKRTRFPIIGQRAVCHEDIMNEMPLLANPRFDDIYQLFKLRFIKDSSGFASLEIIPNSNLNKLECVKARMTIRVYRLDRRHGNKIKGRKEHLMCLFRDFIALAKAKKNMPYFERFKNEHKEHIENLKKYGFYKFIEKDLFEIIDFT